MEKKNEDGYYSHLALYLQSQKCTKNLYTTGNIFQVIKIFFKDLDQIDIFVRIFWKNLRLRWQW